MTSKRPFLLDFPEEFESDRLLIRAPRVGDGEKVNQAVIESFDELKLWMPWAQSKPTLDDSEEHCRISRTKFLAREDLQLLLFLKSSGELIGSSGLHRFDWTVPKFEIGYWCRSTFTGKGYISEAVVRIAQFAFEELAANRVEIKADSDNEKSCNIPERLGFHFEGLLRNDDRCSLGKLRDTRLYSIISLGELSNNINT